MALQQIVGGVNWSKYSMSLNKKNNILNEHNQCRMFNVHSMCRKCSNDTQKRRVESSSINSSLQPLKGFELLLSNEHREEIAWNIVNMIAVRCHSRLNQTSQEQQNDKNTTRKSKEANRPKKIECFVQLCSALLPYFLSLSHFRFVRYPFNLYVWTWTWNMEHTVNKYRMAIERGKKN